MKGYSPLSFCSCPPLNQLICKHVDELVHRLWLLCIRLGATNVHEICIYNKHAKDRDVNPLGPVMRAKLPI